MKKKLLITLLILIIPILIMVVFNQFGLYFGSKTDWISQHIIFPDYFRKLFYKTGNIVPNFAFHIGAGQNIFNFAYYGFLNPIILISYLLPFIKMVDYITYVSILSSLLSSVLCYKWLIKKNNNKLLSLLLSFLFLMAGPIIFHSHRHIMFINYFPFLFLGLIGIDKYFKENKSWLLIISIFFLIMTSYYYSVCSLMALVIYHIYKYLKRTNKFNFKDFIIKMLKDTIPYIIGILLASILLLPTFYVIFNGRSDTTLNLNLINLIIPHFEAETLLYDSYSLGLTAISIIAIIYSFLTSKKEQKFLSITTLLIMILPVFMYVLNGGLYIRAKALIPLIPLIILIINNFLTTSDLEKNKMKHIVFISIIINIFFFINNYYNIYYYLEINLIIILLLLSYKKSKIPLYILMVIVAIINLFNLNLGEEYVTKKEYNNYFNKDEAYLINKITNENPDFYRLNNLNNTLHNINKVYNLNYYQTSLYSSTYNNDYRDFYYNVFENAFPHRNLIMMSSSNNILFQTYMGIEYIISSNDPPIGYNLVEEKNKVGVYQNDNVYSIGYVLDKTMSLEQFNNLKYPYNVEALMNYIITDNNESNELNSNIQKYNLDYNSDIGKNIIFDKVDNGYNILVNSNDNIILSLNEKIVNNILLLDFELEEAQSCDKGDMAITINGITNTLTCEDWIYANNNKTFSYVISSNEDIDKLNINFSRGNYKIRNINTYILNYNKVISNIENIDKFIIDSNKTKGDKIIGNISVKKDGYFILNIPYDTGFTIKVNNKLVNYEKVNTSFIGFPLVKGDYKIELTYISPLFKEGLILSTLGLLLFGVIIYYENKKHID